MSSFGQSDALSTLRSVAWDLKQLGMSFAKTGNEYMATELSTRSYLIKEAAKTLEDCYEKQIEEDFKKAAESKTPTRTQRQKKREA